MRHVGGLSTTLSVPADWLLLESHLKRLGWSKADLARECEIHPNSVSRWRSNGVPPIVLKHLALRIETHEGWEVKPGWKLARIEQG